jgi:vancomycin resistance protein YoaR
VGVSSSSGEESLSRRERREAAGGSHMPVMRGNRVVFGILAAALLVCAVIGADIAVSWGRIHPGVKVAGIDVGSKTPAAASALLNASFERQSAEPVVVSAGKETWKVAAADVDASLDVTASVAAAMSVGRSRGAAAMIGDRFSAIFRGVDIAAHVLANDEKLAKVLDRAEKAIAVPSKNASVTIEEAKAVFHASQAGDMLDRQATADALLAAFLTSERSVSARVVHAPVLVSDDDARQAFEDAKKLLNGPVTVTYEGRSLVVPVEKVASWVRFDIAAAGQGGAEGVTKTSGAATGSVDASAAATAPRVLVASFDATRVGSAISSLTGGLGTKPRDASFAVTGGKVTIKPSKTGRGADLATLAKDLAAACTGSGERSAEVQLVEIQPALTTEAARDMGISDRISTYTTYYPGSASARVNNIHTLAKAFDAKLVPPGGVFSFNGTAGERTAAKGYQEAPAIVNGKLVPQLGGGVCQVGTTFFNAVFFSGLPVVERRNHSFYISHYPKGRDATVSWGGPDFKFKNNTDGWILIRTSYTNSSLTISLYGTDPGYEVEYTTSDFTNVVPYRVEEIKDPKLRKGARIVEDGGVNGGRVTVVRKVYKGGELVRTDTFVSRYTAKTKVVRFGTKSSTPTTSTP